MNHGTPAYGLWPLVVINSAVFMIFAFSFAKPRSARDRRAMCTRTPPRPCGGE